MKKGWSYLMLGFGIFSLILSIWMLPLQMTGSTERTITYVNLVIAVILMVISLLFSVKERRNKKDSYDEKGV
ncbi:MAG: hypothetical protein VB088_00060 [Sphaerochaeta sp.]|jgi:hypothetical protein|uniref:hypothetical protein n=1 Tax=unclassified Sphaerochaeta TaxID=2637943 RepID=UPI000E91A752|nr:MULTISPECIES: hypothetical protein [unclassified Sphaerochaeta]MCK9599671.1 hypothetical protein [Sphaerochaeta sp.]MEA4863769.1 hypothetical protein [Sphaerochaeta sp.]HBO36336.1 hypothetical protein [Sphaerochaeta sp.]